MNILQLFGHKSVRNSLQNKRRWRKGDVEMTEILAQRLIGQYAHWRCDRCGIEKEHAVSRFTRANGELMPTCGWACRKCGMRGRMVFQELIGKEKGEERMINTKKLKEGEIVFVDLAGTDSTGEESECLTTEDIKCKFVNGCFHNIENNRHKGEIYGSSVVSFRTDKKERGKNRR